MNKIEQRYYVVVELKLLSPLAVANGESENTDADVVRSAGGEAFLPGTSIAGVFRAYIEQKKNVAGLMGYSSDADGRMSSLFINDAYFKEPRVSVRDGVSLENRIAKPGGKFDFEIIETGATTTLFMEYVKRENDTLDGLALIARMIYGMDSGEVRFGAKKNRGLGSVEVTGVYKAEFDSGKRKEWLDFCGKDDRIAAIRKEEYKWNDWKEQGKPENGQYVTLVMPLKLEGGISIRKYSAEPEKADFEHITCNGEPVIPGSSWNGAIRARIDEILEELLEELQARDKEDGVRAIVKEWFGYVEPKKEDAGKGQLGHADKRSNEDSNEEKKKTVRQSNIIFGESILEGSTKLVATRNKINRFDASTVNGALYTETAYFGGKTKLCVKIRKTDGYKALLGMMLLVLDEIGGGYIAVGGQTSVGRGIFSLDGKDMLKILPEGTENKDEALRALYSELCSIKGRHAD